MSENIEKTKRSRSANWELTEKSLLKKCIKEHITIIECKTCNTNINRKKQDAWKQVFRRFNELNDRERGLNELKQQWRSAKFEAKRRAEHKKLLRQTGGGPKPPSPTPNIQEIIYMISQESEEDDNLYDSDKIIFMKTEDEVENRKRKKTEEGNLKESVNKQVEQDKRKLPIVDITSIEDTSNDSNNQITLEAGSSMQSDHSREEWPEQSNNITLEAGSSRQSDHSREEWPEKSNNVTLEAGSSSHSDHSREEWPEQSNNITLEAGSSRQSDHSREEWPEQSNNIAKERQPEPSKKICPKTKHTNIGKKKLENRKSRDMVLIDCLKKEHELKMEQMAESHQWQKEEHALKIRKLKLEIIILEKEIQQIQ